MQVYAPRVTRGTENEGAVVPLGTRFLIGAGGLKDETGVDNGHVEITSPTIFWFFPVSDGRDENRRGDAGQIEMSAIERICRGNERHVGNSV